MLEGDDLQRTISLLVGKTSVLVSKLCDCMILFSLLDERFFGSFSLYYIYTHTTVGQIIILVLILGNI